MHNPHENADLYKQAWRDCPAGIALVSPDGTFRATSPSCGGLFGYSESELLSFSVLELFHHADRKAFIAELTKLGDDPEREGMFMAARITKKDGDALWVCVAASPQRDKAERLTGVVLFFQEHPDSKELTLQPNDSGAAVRTMVGFSDLWSAQPKACVAVLVFLFCLVKAIDMSVFSQVLALLKGLLNSPTP